MKHETRSVEVNYPDGTVGTMDLQYPIKEKEKVIIVGCAGTKTMVPWDDKDAEFWGVNNLYGVPLEGRHYDRWFEIHNIWQDPQRQNKLIRRGSEEFRGQNILEYLKGLGELNCTVYMQRHWPDLIPMSVPYPIQEVIDYFHANGIAPDICRYLTNTITYEIILAIYLGFKEIQIWGVDMSAGTEYEWQKPSCEFWMGVAAGMGIKVFLPPQSDLLKTKFLYGFEEAQQNQWKEKLEKIRKDMKIKRLNLEQQYKQAGDAIQQHLGGEQVINEIQRIWDNAADDRLYLKRGS